MAALASLIMEAVAALEHASGRLEELDRRDEAHRCAIVAARLRAACIDALPEDEPVTDDEAV